MTLDSCAHIPTGATVSSACWHLASDPRPVGQRGEVVVGRLRPFEVGSNAGGGGGVVVEYGHVLDDGRPVVVRKEITERIARGRHPRDAEPNPDYLAVLAARFADAAPE